MNQARQPGLKKTLKKLEPLSSFARNELGIINEQEAVELLREEDLPYVREAQECQSGQDFQKDGGAEVEALQDREVVRR